MAWRCSGRTNAELIENLFSNGLITSPAVKRAMMNVDRAHYVPPTALKHAYSDSPQPIGHAATISAPHMHASAIEHLLPFLRPGQRVLDIGSGSGYLTAVLAELVFPPSASTEGTEEEEEEEGEKEKEDGKNEKHKTGLVVGVEHISQLRELGELNMRRCDRGSRLLNEGKVKFVLGDGRLGFRESQPQSHSHSQSNHLADNNDNNNEQQWDAIHVGAAASSMPEALIAQLAAPGRMFIPVADAVANEDEDADGEQHIWLVEKSEQGSVTRERLFGVRYVPLTDSPVG